jgi:hypothetical protein
VIIEARHLLAEALASIGYVVWDFEPANLPEVPAVVVGRPSMEVLNPLFTITCAVWVVGRRNADRDAVDELDVLTDSAVALIRKVAVVTAISPAVRTVAELTYPAYRIDCVTGQGSC